jgi:acylphosphatase
MRLHLKVKGKVQGVFFRDSTQKKAGELGLNGYAKNLPDGTVEIIAEGPEDRLLKLLSWARVGSPLSKVTDIQETWEEDRNEFSDFQVR